MSLHVIDQAISLTPCAGKCYGNRTKPEKKPFYSQLQNGDTVKSGLYPFKMPTFTVFTEMWGFYEHFQLFLWFPGGLESTWTQYFFIRNDVIADHLEYSLPSWEVIDLWVFVLDGNVFISDQSCVFVLWFGSRSAPDSLDCVCVTTPRLWSEFLLMASMLSLTCLWLPVGVLWSLSQLKSAVSVHCPTEDWWSHIGPLNRQRSLVVQDPQVTAEQYVVHDFSMTGRMSTL